MISLQELLNELEDDFLAKGFKLGEPTVDPETGSSSTTVTYLPKLKQTRIDLYKMREQFRPYKYSSNPDIAKLSKEISTAFTKLNNMILALDGMIEAEKQR
jgi:hypothetical protein